MSFLYSFDIFSRKPRLKINGNTRLSSKVVAIFGILLLAGFVAIIAYLSSEVLNKKTFNIIENTYSKTFNNITLDYENPISFTLTDIQGNEIINYERIFDMKLKHFDVFTKSTLNSTGNIIITNIERSKCTYKKLPGDVIQRYEEIYRAYNKSMHCFDLKPYNISIFGEDSPSPHGFLLLYINQCRNTTKNSNCLPQADLDRILSEVKVSFIFPNFDTNNELSNPFIKYSDGRILRFSNSLKTRYIFEIENLEFLSDEGLIFEDIVKSEAYHIKETSIFQNLALGNMIYSGTFGNINIYGSGKKKVYQRRFIKFHAILPYIISIYQITILIFKLLVDYFGGGKLEEYLFSNLIEKEEFDKFKVTERLIIYDDLFKKKLNEESKNLDSNSEEKFDEPKIEYFNEFTPKFLKNKKRKSEEFIDQSINCHREIVDNNNEFDEFKCINQNNEILKNNFFFPKEDIINEEIQIKSKNTKINFNSLKKDYINQEKQIEISDKDNSKNIIIPKENIEFVKDTKTFKETQR
jgi:hypothetical protein